MKHSKLCDIHCDEYQCSKFHQCLNTRYNEDAGKPWKCSHIYRENYYPSEIRNYIQDSNDIKKSPMCYIFYSFSSISNLQVLQNESSVATLDV